MLLQNIAYLLIKSGWNTYYVQATLLGVGNVKNISLEFSAEIQDCE